MPIYEYKCTKCGKAFEYFAQRINERPGKCPECGADQVEKQLSTFSVGAGGSSSGGDPSCSTGTCPTGSCPL